VPSASWAPSTRKPSYFNSKIQPARVNGFRTGASSARSLCVTAVRRKLLVKGDGMARRLNGWQRLWVVALGAWAVYCFFDLLPQLPTMDRTNDTLDRLLVLGVALKAPDYGYTRTDDARKTFFADARGDELRVIAKRAADDPKIPFLVRVEIAGTVSSWEDDVRGLWKRQLEWIGALLLLTLLPGIIVYVLGLVAVWVKRGFSQSS
jgi:hypothetical protein